MSWNVCRAHIFFWLVREIDRLIAHYTSGVFSDPPDQWGLCEYVIVHTILGGSPVILWISLGGKPKWLPLKFGYHDIMRTSPIHLNVDIEFDPGMVSKGVLRCRIIDSHAIIAPMVYCREKTTIVAVTWWAKWQEKAFLAKTLPVLLIKKMERRKPAI